MCRKVIHVQAHIYVQPNHMPTIIQSDPCSGSFYPFKTLLTSLGLCMSISVFSYIAQIEEYSPFYTQFAHCTSHSSLILNQLAPVQVKEASVEHNIRHAKEPYASGETSIAKSDFSRISPLPFAMLHSHLQYELFLPLQ